MMVTMISLALKLIRRNAGKAAQAPPATNAPAARTGRRKKLGRPNGLKPRPTVAIAPRYNWPSPPTFQMPHRKLRIVASAVSKIGVMYSSVSARPLSEPKAPATISPYTTNGSIPNRSRKIPAKTNAPIIIATGPPKPSFLRSHAGRGQPLRRSWLRDSRAISGLTCHQTH